MVNLKTAKKNAPAVPRVVVLCNSPDTGPAWAYCLQKRQMQVILETSPSNLMQKMTEYAPDLLVVDITHGSSGYASLLTLVKECRGETANPILLLTSQQDEEHLLEIYDAGVDDVIIKPVSPAMFIAKTHAWLRRSWTVPVDMLDRVKVNQITLIPGERLIEIPEQGRVRLTNMEIRLLHVLMSCPGKTLKSEELITRTWGYSGEVDNTVLKNMIYRLRHKIETDPANPRIILKVAGIGYQFIAA